MFCKTPPQKPCQNYKLFKEYIQKQERYNRTGITNEGVQCKDYVDDNNKSINLIQKFISKFSVLISIKLRIMGFNRIEYKRNGDYEEIKLIIEPYIEYKIMDKK